MGVKSTDHLTREDAESLYLDLRRKISGAQDANPARWMSNADLEEALERMSDEAAGGEGFRNFTASGEEPAGRPASHLDLATVMTVEEVLARRDDRVETLLEGEGLSLVLTTKGQAFEPAAPGERLRVRITIEPE